MAWIFSLSAECGPHRAAADALARHFDGLVITCASGSRHECATSVYEFRDSWWALVCPDDVTRIGVRHEEDRRQLTELAIALYDRLRTAPAFRYALVGVEVDCFRSFDELDDVAASPPFDGLVLADGVWQHIGSPEMFVPFVPGYRWTPFERVV